MKSFLKYVLATVTGVIISFFLIFLIIVGILTALISTATKDESVIVANNSVLHIQLNHTISERTIPNLFEDLDLPGFSSSKSLGLDDILTRIKGAKDDD